MREYKIRGKTNEDLKWVKGYLYAFNGGFRIEDEWWAHDVIPGTLGQYTGFKDKKCVEVYEEDIVIWHNEMTDDGKIIESGRGIVYFDLSDGSYKVKPNDFRPWLKLSSLKYAGLEVIGNIYDNPYLLKEKVE